MAFCEREWSRLVGALVLLLGDRLAAEDLAQETLARVCRDWDRVRTLESPGGWAHRVACNLAASHRRRDRVARRALDRVAGRPLSPPADDADAVAVRDAILMLPERERRALVLRFFADLSVRDTAAAMRVPEGTVKTLTRSAIAALRASGLVTSTDHEAEASNAPGHR